MLICDSILFSRNLISCFRICGTLIIRVDKKIITRSEKRCFLRFSYGKFNPSLAASFVALEGF
ncbi:hypothetical protein D7X25_29465, partial [bacterium 1XD42-8]